ncbi:sulfatase [Ruficoccus sp. ZRK36]|uniref:sulfatase n=1 Tax=Ruficoccus sp. ZRK36 TaxID=2866311 RepID=UPI001C734BDB|nr:sulfatase [Ruficoccus sp. ZRK36]QYY36767.1 sulfatase [Ruficoccus sp. ZRK36]
MKNFPRFATLALACALGSQSASAKNVIFVLADDLSPRLECYGGDVISPNLDNLASEGALFEHAYAQATICTPSRASIMTGMRPDEAGPRDNNYRRSYFRNYHPDVQTLPQYVQQFGYTSIGLGKTYGPHDPASWSRDDLGEAKGPEQYALPENSEIFIKNSKAGKRGWFNRGPLTEAADVPDNAYPDGRVTDRAIEVIHELKDEPFFLYIGYQRPHRPFTAPKKYFDMYADKELSFPGPGGYPEDAPELALKSHRTASPKPGDKNYERDYDQLLGHYASATYVDALVGKVMDTLKELNLDDDTLVIFSADHGFHVGENGQWDKSALFETTCAVPLIIYMPGDKALPLRIDQPVELLDIYPTVLDFLELPHPPQLEGKSLLPLMTNKGASGKDYAYTEVLRSKGGKNAAMNWDGSIEGRSLRSGDYRLNRWWDAHTGEVLAIELYDYSLPEPEIKNLAGDPAYADVQAQLLAQLNEQWPLPTQSK